MEKFVDEGGFAGLAWADKDENFTMEKVLGDVLIDCSFNCVSHMTILSLILSVVNWGCFISEVRNLYIDLACIGYEPHLLMGI